MKIEVQVKPNAKIEKVERQPDGSFRVWVNAPPQEGKANAAVIALLSAHFKVPKSQVHLLHGTKGKKKLFEIGS